MEEATYGLKQNIEGVRGGDGVLRFVVKYLAIFYALSTTEATATAPMSGSNFGRS